MESPLLQRTGRPSPLLLEAFPEDLRVGEEQEQSVPTPGAGQGGTRLAGSGKRPMRNMGIGSPHHPRGAQNCTGEATGNTVPWRN